MPRYIDADAIPWEEHYVPDPDSDKQWDYKKELCVLKPVIDQLPTVDAVEVVHGHWVGGYKGTEYTIPKCSQCGYGNGAVGTSNYCPNCGADMRGDGNG